MPGNLLGRPVLVQILAHLLEQDPLTVQLGLWAAMGAALAAALLGKAADVAITARIAADLPADAAGATAQGFGNGPDALLLLQSQSDRVAL